ncbi:MAG: hypothetical protein LBL63_00415 [Clostridiales Family XIII bacterium]|jgi:hypothetical protein|nr:hypothetical protein [Clostridiales Family XIII bacterium]
MKNFEIPTIPIRFPDRPRDYPISPRENLMRAFNQEKPLWMPNLESSSLSSPTAAYGDIAPTVYEDSADWFGVRYRFSAAQGTSTPERGLFNEIKEWKEKIVWPDLDGWDWKRGYADFVRDESRATGCLFGYGIWEKLHVFEGFEQALADLALEPEACRAFFEHMADHKIEVFKRLNDVYHYDWVAYHDDWGTARAPFFSINMWKETIFRPTVRIMEALRGMDVKVLFHNCGLVEAFVPYLVDELHADGLQIQIINDIKRIVETYGDRTTVHYRPDAYIMYDPDTTPDRARAYARELVDAYGAHVNPGAGVFMSAYALREDVYYAFDDEIFNYSLEKYGGL